jgi:hypothetical protein
MDPLHAVFIGACIVFLVLGILNGIDYLDEDNWNLLSVDEEDETRQIFAWAHMPDDMDIFPMSAMTSILQKKRWDNV